MENIDPRDYESIRAALEEVKKDKNFMSTLQINSSKHKELLSRLELGPQPTTESETRARKLSEIVQQIKDEDAEILRRLGRLDQAIPVNIEDL